MKTLKRLLLLAFVVAALGAGWLRLAWLPCLVFMTIGKAARYAALTGYF